MRAMLCIWLRHLNEMYGWGYVVKKESYRDNELSGRALSQHICMKTDSSQVGVLA